MFEMDYLLWLSYLEYEEPQKVPNENLTVVSTVEEECSEQITENNGQDDKICVPKLKE